MSFHDGMPRTSLKLRSPTHGFVSGHAGEPIEELLVGHARRVLVGHVPVDVVEAQAVVDRQPGDPPLILREDAEVVGAIELEIRRRALKDAQRRAVPERVLHVAVRDEVVVGDEVLELEPGLHGVRAGDVGHGRPLHVAVRVVRMASVGPRGAVADAEADVGDRDGFRLHAGLPERVPLRNRRAHAGFEQQSARQRRVVRPLHEPVRLESIAAADFLQRGRRRRSAIAGVLIVGDEVEFVLRMRLPRQPAQARCRTIPTGCSTGRAADRSRA